MKFKLQFLFERNFLVEMKINWKKSLKKIQWMKFFSWNENFPHWKKCFSMIPHPSF